MPSLAEGSPVVQKGDVCLIPNCKEFFIATAAHEEWGHAHSVWGRVEEEDHVSWDVINAMPVEPFTTITDGGVMNDNASVRDKKQNACGTGSYIYSDFVMRCVLLECDQQGIEGVRFEYRPPGSTVPGVRHVRHGCFANNLVLLALEQDHVRPCSLAATGGDDVAPAGQLRQV
eukprot:213604-Chlamydomonas_euryale.AAC.39